MFQKISFAVTSLARNTRSKRRMTREPAQKIISSVGLLAVLNDPDKASDDLRRQLDGFSSEELVAGTRIVKRLLDCCLMAMAWFMFVCNYFDRVRAYRFLIPDSDDDEDLHKNRAVSPRQS